MDDQRKETLIHELQQAARVLHELQSLPATDGNLSARLTSGIILITRSQIEKRVLKEGDILEVNLTEVTPKGVSSEWPMHQVLYEANADTNAVLHVHAPYLTAFAAARRAPNRAFLAEACAEIGIISVIDYRAPGTCELAEALKAADHRTGVYLLSNHGAVAVGKTVSHALHRLERAEFLARIEWIAASLGGGVPISASEILRLTGE